jgi:DNA repair exonuclease SbcCD ATPase subunit
MKIVKLNAENILKLSAIEIVPQDNMILITGENGAGKSSVLDSIVMALTGGKSIPSEPVKKGSEKGKIVIDMGEFTITRSFTKDNSYLKIEAADGKDVKSPQKFLDNLIGKVSFDPLEFINNHKESEQRDILLQLIGVNVDELDAKEKQLRDERTEVGRDMKKAENLYKSIEYFPQVKETEEQTIGDLSAQLAAIINANQVWDNLNNQGLQLRQKGKDLRARINEMETEILSIKAQYEEIQGKLVVYSKQDPAGIQSKMAELESNNAKIRANNNRKSTQADFDNYSQQYETKTKAIEKLDTDRKSLLSSATMPVDGLSFNDACLTYNDIPLAQCSDGEKLMVSLGISMALNPTLRVLRIKDGSLLDEKNRAIIRQQIKDKDFQLWMESVSSDKSVGIFIEEGEIVAVDGKAPEKEKVVEKKSKSKVVEKVVKKTPTPKPETPEDW